MVEPLYCEDNGRPSIDPVVLFKMVLIQHLYGLPSLRRTAEEVNADREAHGKKPFSDDENDEDNENNDEPPASPKKKRNNTSRKKLKSAKRKQRRQKQ